MRYTHQDATGMRWRFVGSRPVSELADQVTAEVDQLSRQEEELRRELKDRVAAKLKRRNQKEK